MALSHATNMDDMFTIRKQTYSHQQHSILDSDSYGHLQLYQVLSLGNSRLHLSSHSCVASAHNVGQAGG